MLDSTLFRSYKLNENGINKVQFVRDVFNELLASLVDIVPEGREFAITKTKLEEAGFYAIKAISINGINHAK